MIQYINKLYCTVSDEVNIASKPMMTIAIIAILNSNLLMEDHI